MTTTSVHVADMSCSHCVTAVTNEVTKIGGVTRVEVDLVSGMVEIESDGPIETAEVAAAIDEAGYEVTS